MSETKGGNGKEPNGGGGALARVAGVDIPRLRSFVERVERLQEEIHSLNADKSDVYSQAKDEGFSVEALKTVIKRRRKGHEELENLDWAVDLYERVLAGEAVAAEPVGRNQAAYAAGRQDGLLGVRDGAADWPPGEAGHADYELGYEDGNTTRVDSEEGAPPRARARARGRRQAAGAFA